MSPATEQLIMRAPRPADAAGMWRLAAHGLDVNSPYSYLMLAEHFAATCAVAVRAGDPLDAEPDAMPAGFVTGFRLPADPSTLFIWQIVVDPAYRGRSLGTHLLDELAERPMVPRLRFLEATVTPSNEASARTFRRFARRRQTDCVEAPLFGRDLFPGPGHEPEHRFRIGPF